MWSPWVNQFHFSIFPKGIHLFCFGDAYQRNRRWWNETVKHHTCVTKKKMTLQETHHLTCNFSSHFLVAWWGGFSFGTFYFYSLSLKAFVMPGKQQGPLLLPDLGLKQDPETTFDSLEDTETNEISPTSHLYSCRFYWCQVTRSTTRSVYDSLWSNTEPSWPHFLFMELI